MRLREIESLPSDDYDLKDFEDQFGDNTVWVDPNDPSRVIRYQMGRMQSLLGVFQEDILIALLVVEPFYRHSGVSQIKLTATHPEYRKRGYLRLLINYYRSHYGLLCSDEAQTDEAKEMWQALIKQPMGLDIRVWNVATGAKMLSKEVPEGDIWNGEADVVLIVEDADLYRYGNRRENLLEVAASLPTQRRWGGTPHNLFP